jgi:hypothetical protein
VENPSTIRGTAAATSSAMKLAGPFLILALLAACADSEPEALPEESVHAAAVIARGGRVLAMDVGPGPGETREAAVAKAKAAGVTTVVLNYDWVELEPAAFQYQAARLIADNAFFSTAPHAMSVVLNLRPIAGACRVVPPDLQNVAWSDPVMTTRFGYLLTWIRGHLPNVTVQVMSVGTEVDSHLAPADYPAYKVFFEAARSNAKAQWGAALPVGVAITWGALTTPGAEQAAILDLNEHADHVLTTYYGIGADLKVKDPYAGPVADVYAALWAVESSAKTRGRTLDLLEVGYPTSAALGSSNAKQQTFLSTMFGIWDAYYPSRRVQRAGRLDRRLGQRRLPGPRRFAPRGARRPDGDGAGPIGHAHLAVLRGRGQRQRQLAPRPHRHPLQRRRHALLHQLPPPHLARRSRRHQLPRHALRLGRHPGHHRPDRHHRRDHPRRHRPRLLDLPLPGVHPHPGLPHQHHADHRQARAPPARHRGPRSRLVSSERQSVLADLVA